MQAFFDHVRTSVFGGRLRQSQVDGINAILAHSADLPITHRAYILATVVVETGWKMQPIYERWGPTPAQRGYEGRSDLGNTQKGDGFKFRGRGYVQITGRANYTDWATRLGRPLAEEPDIALEPEVAMRILVEGMTLGTFTGKKLSDYLPGNYVQARRVVNGLDRATEIAGYAEEFEEGLRLADKPQEAPKPVPAPEPAPEPVAPPVPAPKPAEPHPVAKDILVDQPTDRTARKVKYSSGGGGLGALAGAVLGTWTFGLTPESFQAVDMSLELWTGCWAGAVSYVAALQIGRRVRESLDNMLPTS